MIGGYRVTVTGLLAISLKNLQLPGGFEFCRPCIADTLCVCLNTSQHSATVALIYMYLIGIAVLDNLIYRV